MTKDPMTQEIRKTKFEYLYSQWASKPVDGRLWKAILQISLVLLCGCQNDPAGDFTDVGEPTETWDVIYAGGSKIGHAHTMIQPVSIGAGDRQGVRITSEQHLAVKRFGQVTRQSLSITSLETTDGQVLAFDTSYTAGKESALTSGKYDAEAKKFVLSTRTKGKTVESSMFWDKEWGGFLAIDQSLADEPMKPRESRTLQAFQPILNQTGKVKLKAAEYEETQLLGETKKLLRINVSIVIRTQSIKQTIWVDRRGNTLKSEMPGIGFLSYRTTKEVASRQSGEPSFDLGEKSIVKVDRELDNAHRTKKIVYKAHVKDGDLKDVFATGPSQSVKLIDDDTAEITVVAIRQNQPETIDVKVAKPTSADFTANNMIQSDDIAIVHMSRFVRHDDTDAWRVAKDLESYVNEKIKNVNFSTAFATASEVAESLEGDCTEHAVLLAALCRARDIPARVAMGLVYFHGKSGPGFAYHMWTEVWTKDRWVPLDATLGLGGIGAGHIKMAHSNLKGADAYSAFLPVIQVMGRLELEIVEVN